MRSPCKWTALRNGLHEFVARRAETERTWHRADRSMGPWITERRLSCDPEPVLVPGSADRPVPRPRGDALPRPAGARRAAREAPKLALPAARSLSSSRPARRVPRHLSMLLQRLPSVSHARRYMAHTSALGGDGALT